MHTILTTTYKRTAVVAEGMPKRAAGDASTQFLDANKGLDELAFLRSSDGVCPGCGFAQKGEGRCLRKQHRQTCELYHGVMVAEALRVGMDVKLLDSHE